MISHVKRHVKYHMGSVPKTHGFTCAKRGKSHDSIMFFFKSVSIVTQLCVRTSVFVNDWGESP